MLKRYDLSYVNSELNFRCYLTAYTSYIWLITDTKKGRNYLQTKF